MTRPRLHAWTIARRATAVLFLAALLAGTLEGSHWFRGSASATTVLNVLPLVDPLAAIEVSLASRSGSTTVLLGAGVLLVMAAVLGPVFCGWVCPLGLLLDVNQTFRRLLLQRTRSERMVTSDGPATSSIRFGVLGFVVAFAAVSQLPLFQILSPINILVRGLLFTVGPALVILVALIGVELVWPRLWCRVLCPLGAAYGLVGRYGLFRVRIDPHRTGFSRCRQCSRDCPMGIRVMEDYAHRDKRWISDSACIRCGNCADVCPRDVLRLGFRQRTASEPSIGMGIQCDEKTVPLPLCPNGPRSESAG